MNIVTQSSLLEHALGYHEVGFSVIPLKNGTKKPAIREWKRYQADRATETKIRKWFSSGRSGIGIIAGEVSGGLCIIDFDVADAYYIWAKKNPELSATLPTVKTRRGFHVYAKLPPNELRSFRESIGKPDGIGAIKMGWGEIIPEGGYAVAPPSRHSDSGEYEWIQLPQKSIPLIGLDSFRLCYTASAETPADSASSGIHKKTQAIKGQDKNVPKPKLSEQVETIIEKTLPRKVGTRNRKIFDLVRELKAIPDLSDVAVNDLESIARRWHRRALPNIATKAWDETWADFCMAWGNVRHPAGESPLNAALQRAIEKPLPEIAFDYDLQATRLLIALCRELQRDAGDRAFYLSSHDAARLVGFKHSMEAWRYLKLFEQTGILKRIHNGSFEQRKASEYRYLHPL
jgi:hypothetical protein